MIHIRLPIDTHRKMRVKCALNGMTIQEYVSSVIAEDVSDLDLESMKRRSRVKSCAL